MLPHHLGNSGHPTTLPHEELNLREGFWHSLMIHLPSRQRGTAVLLSLTGGSCFLSVSLTIYSLASPGPTTKTLGKLSHSSEWIVQTNSRSYRSSRPL